MGRMLGFMAVQYQHLLVHSEETGVDFLLEPTKAVLYIGHIAPQVHRFNGNDIHRRFETIETVIHLVETVIHLVESLVNLIETLIDLFETLIDLLEFLVHVYDQPVDLFAQTFKVHLHILHYVPQK